MTSLLKKYKNLKPQAKASVSALVSVCTNSLLAVGKIVLSIFRGVFFLVSGVVNTFFALAKLECHFGLKNYNNKDFKYKNIMVATFLLIAGLQYAIYMLSLAFWNRTVMQYTDFLSINIALIAFVELGFAIKGMFSIKGKGHYYRDIKLINLCSAMTALMWAEVALLSFTTGTSNMFVCGLSGAIVGLIIVLISIYIYFAPKVSLIDREHNVYKLSKNKQNLLPLNENNEFNLTISKNKIYGDYVYTATFKDGVLNGNISRTKGCWKSINIYLKILIIILSEILIFAYGIGALVYFFKNINLVKNLDKYMENFGYKKIK